MPSTESSVEIKALEERGGTILPCLGVRAFDHHMEIIVVDLAGDPVHTIVIRHMGDVEVDP